MVSRGPWAPGKLERSSILRRSLYWKITGVVSFSR